MISEVAASFRSLGVCDLGKSDKKTCAPEFTGLDVGQEMQPSTDCEAQNMSIHKCNQDLRYMLFVVSGVLHHR